MDSDGPGVAGKGLLILGDLGAETSVWAVIMIPRPEGSGRSGTWGEAD